MVRLSGLWKHKTADGDSKLTGNLGSGRLLVLKNKHKTSDSDADYILYLVEKDVVVSAAAADVGGRL